MTNRDLIKACKAQDCVNCDNCNYWKECDKFRDKYNLSPQKFCKRPIGSILKTPSGQKIKLSKEFLEREVGK